MDPAFFTDPSKDAFEYIMLDRSKDWRREDEDAKMKMMNEIKDGDTGFLKILGNLADAKILLMIGIFAMVMKIWLPEDVIK